MAGEPSEFRSCDVCGRTILRGERVRDYVTPQGEAVGVCALCMSRAETAGWVPEELVGERSHGHQSRRLPALALRSRLRGAAGRARQAASTGRERIADRQTERRDRREAHREAADPEPERASPARRQRPETERPHASRAEEPVEPARDAPRTPELVMRRALDVFNSSHELRKVSGLIRSLGAPRVSVRAEGPTALVTVAWELSWYQWEIDTGGDGGIREVAKGDEVSELDEASQAWNGAAAEDGSLRLAA